HENLAQQCLELASCQLNLAVRSAFERLHSTVALINTGKVDNWSGTFMRRNQGNSL
ncbi:unnamed protein product, partial [Allacma fusca]